MARCPECKGEVLRESTDEGLTEWGVCDACGTYFCDEQTGGITRQMRVNYDTGEIREITED